MPLVLVDRLRILYWPDWLWSYYADYDPWSYQPIKYYEEPARNEVTNYDERRVRYFMDRIVAGEKLSPIVVDWEWWGIRPSRLCLIDGHHRYMAAVLIGLEKIPCSYGGPVEALEWLRGKLRHVPSSLSDIIPAENP
jgi:hypothetical protein